jgi:proteasome lid subunit RPN8/RPN11
MTHLKLRLQTLARMVEHAERGYPEEACGGLLGLVQDCGDVEVRTAVPLANARQEQRCQRYLIGPDEVRTVEKHAAAASLELVGFYHSHPNAAAVPSTFDREQAWPWYTYLIVSVLGGRAAATGAWRLAHDRERFEPVVLVEQREPIPEVDVR